MDRIFTPDSHKWLRFTLDLQRAPWTLWLLCGEALSKTEHLAGVPLAPAAAEELNRINLAKGALATTAIEGNTLTEKEALERVEGKLRLPTSKEYLGVEIDNVVRASREILHDCLLEEKGGLTPDLLRHFNAELLKDLHLEPHIQPGEFRDYQVVVADYRAVPAADVHTLVRQLCDWLNTPWIEALENYGDLDRKRLEAILKAIVAHLYVAWIHPFGDGNGRTARLVEFFILAHAGIPFPACHLLSNHYNETRAEYYRQLSYASKSGRDVLGFCEYALRGFVDQLRAQIMLIRKEQIQLFWEHHVYQTLGDSETGRRRRYLVLDLARHDEGVPRSELTDLSVRVFRHYHGKADKTMARDLAELERLKLIYREMDTGSEHRFHANVDVVLAYLPPRRLQRRDDRR